MDASKQVMDQLHADLVKQFEGVTTWDAMYDKLNEYFVQFRQCGCEYHAFHMGLMQQAFIMTLREYPEEGDIVKIIEYMLHSICYQTMEKFGYKWISMADLQAAAGNAMSAFAAMASQGHQGHAEGDEKNAATEAKEQLKLPPPDPKKTVH